MKKSKIIGLLAMSAVMLTGCVDAMPDMTTEQSDMVAEYAAGLLLKYSPNYDYRLVSDDELAAALVQETEVSETAAEQERDETASEEQTEAKENPKQEQESEAASETEQTEQQFLDADTDLAMELGLSGGISLRYQSFEICDSYPQNASGFSGVDAGQDRKLLVLHFDLENITNEKLDCQLFDSSLRLRVTVNESLSMSTLDTSMLPDDMASFIGSIESGGKADVTAVAEIADMSDEDIVSLTIQMSSQNGSCNVKVR